MRYQDGILHHRVRPELPPCLPVKPLIPLAKRALSWMDAGAPGSLWLLVQCGQKYIFSGTDSVQSNSSCIDFGSNSLDVRVDLGTVQFSDDYCTSLSVPHGLGAGPLYLFIGALCNYLNCPGETNDCPVCYDLIMLAIHTHWSVIYRCGT